MKEDTPDDYEVVDPKAKDSPTYGDVERIVREGLGAEGEDIKGVDWSGFHALMHSIVICDRKRYHWQLWRDYRWDREDIIGSVRNLIFGS